MVYDDADSVGGLLVQEVQTRLLSNCNSEAELAILVSDIQAARSSGYPADELARIEERVLQSCDRATALLLCR